MLSWPSWPPRRFSGCSRAASLWDEVVRLGALEFGDDRLTLRHQATGRPLAREGKDAEAEPAAQAASPASTIARDSRKGSICQASRPGARHRVAGPPPVRTTPISFTIASRVPWTPIARKQAGCIVYY